jgi:hypothetical protein
MGYLKQLQLENEGLRRIAEEIAIRVGLLARCPFCETMYDPLTWLHVDAYRLANWLISRPRPTRRWPGRRTPPATDRHPAAHRPGQHERMPLRCARPTMVTG